MMSAFFDQVNSLLVAMNNPMTGVIMLALMLGVAVGIAVVKLFVERFTEREKLKNESLLDERVTLTDDGELLREILVDGKWKRTEE